jgi:extracellular matrix protein 14
LLPKTNIVPTGQETFNAVLALGKYLLGDRGIEFDWEKEFISVPNVAEKLGRVQDQETPSSENEAEELIRESEEEEDEWNLELRRRRRR